MFASPVKADMRALTSPRPLSANKRHMHCSKKARLFDHLVGAREQRWRHVEAERFRGF
jgi:hypothetical protein